MGCGVGALASYSHNVIEACDEVRGFPSQSLGCSGVLISIEYCKAVSLYT